MSSGSREAERREAPIDAVRVIRKEIVAPATPTPRHTFFLSGFDILWKTHYYHQTVFFYEGTGLSRHADEGQVMVQKLKSSLALCLAHYYPWCGRLSRPVAAGDRLSIDCNDAGVEFVEACLPHLPISLLSSQAFQFKPFFKHLCPHVDLAGDCLYSSPLLSIQATLFSDGGLALGYSHSHVVADGQSMCNFMVSWGECARGLALSLAPLLDRERLAVPNPCPEKATWELTAEIKEEDEQEKLQKKEGGVEGEQGDSSGVQASVQEERVLCVFNLAASAVEKLRKQGGGVHTFYEVTCAHLWQRVTVARQRPSREPAYFLVVANFRSRIKPPLPPAFFGNAVAYKIVVGASGKICRESLHATASRIHDAIVETIQSDSITSLMHWLEIHDHAFVEKASSKISEGEMAYMAHSPWFPIYEVDFGWGQPMAVRFPSMQEDGEMMIAGGHPKANPRDVEICTCLPRNVLRRLLKDPLFLGQTLFNPLEDS